MTLQELDKKYYFHDSSIISINYDKEKNIVEMLIDFCFWMQEDFKEGEPENGEAKLIFRQAHNYDGPLGELNSNSILRTFVKENNQFLLCMSDDNFTNGNYTSDYYEIKFNAECAEFIPLKQ